MINFLKRNQKIRIRDDHIFQQKAYDSVSIDQYMTMRRAEEEMKKGESGDAGRSVSRPSERKRYPCLCELCGVKVNSEVVFREHIRGNRHRVNMLKKDINSKR